jgi:hypothetical protein
LIARSSLGVPTATDPPGLVGRPLRSCVLASEFLRKVS